ncbi:CBS domain-containing protein [Nocardioides dilutus]
MLVREVMTDQAVTVTRDTSVKEALALLERHQITAAPVLDVAARIEGMVSEADLIRDLLQPDQRTHEWPTQEEWRDRPRVVGDVMSTHPVTVAPETDLAAAVELMTTLGIKSVPVVDRHHRLAGMLSRSDVVRVLARSDDEIERDVDAMLTEVGLGDWLVAVNDGQVDLSGPEDSPYRMTARAVAESVLGVVAVQVKT